MSGNTSKLLRKFALLTTEPDMRKIKREWLSASPKTKAKRRRNVKKMWSDLPIAKLAELTVALYQAQQKRKGR